MIYKRQLYDSYKYTLANLNLRKDKYTTATILTVIPSKSKVMVIDAEEDWYKVEYNNLIGYVYSYYLSKTKYPWTNVILRTLPSSQSKPITTITSKSRIQVLDTTGDWSHVIFNNQEGYVFSYFLSDDGNPPEAYDFTYFYTDMTKFVNNNNIKSPTANLITTDLKNKITYIFEKDDKGAWSQIYKWDCTIGKPSTPTIKGTFYVTGRKPYFGTDDYSVKYATRIKGGYYYHSILFDSKGTKIIDSRLGMALSHGCIRLSVKNAQYIYDNILDTTTIIIN